MALRKHGTAPGDGEVLVTGAAGGGLGRGRAARGTRLHRRRLHGAGAGGRLPARARRLGDHRPQRPLGPGQAAADRALGRRRRRGGSHTRWSTPARTRFNGAVAACGLAQGADLPGTVLPFILRGVTLYGINCVFVANALRLQAWDLLAKHLDPASWNR